MGAQNLHTHDPDKCFCTSTDFEAVALGKIILTINWRQKIIQCSVQRECLLSLSLICSNIMCVPKYCPGPMATGKRDMEKVQRRTTRTNGRLQIQTKSEKSMELEFFYREKTKKFNKELESKETATEKGPEKIKL